MVSRRYFPFLLLFAALFACDSNPGGSESITSGIEGVVLRGPICPVVQEGEPCPDEPFAAEFNVLDQDENQLATFQTGDDGMFEIELPAGSYLIVPEETAPVINPASQMKQVTVEEEQVTSVTLLFDTGIR